MISKKIEGFVNNKKLREKKIKVESRSKLYKSNKKRRKSNKEDLLKIFLEEKSEYNININEFSYFKFLIVLFNFLK